VKCQECSNPATVHLTNLMAGGQKKEVHLCKECAEKQHLLKQEELDLTAILQTVIGQNVGPVTDELSRLTCPACGIKYMEFKAEGRLGCPRDYQVFQAALEPLLQRIHRADRHKGKVPRRGPLPAVLEAELVGLRQRLHQAVLDEAYEEAARLRDLIRQKECQG
jgi:protein arginine kinase activator